MSELFRAGVGRVLSADIAVPEYAREIEFYAQVLGTGKSPLWREDLTSNLGTSIIGVGERGEEYAHLPLQWMPHIQVADVAASVERALSRGGTELMHGRGHDGVSQWAVLLDPCGAAFGIIPVIPPGAIPAVDDAGPPDSAAAVGRIAWADLTVRDASEARDFYRDVIGWSPQDVAMADATGDYSDYSMLGGSGDPVAGVCHARGVNLSLPPVWMIYLPVADLDESLRHVGEGGGRIIKASKRSDGEYGYALVQDPVGAYLGLVPG